MISHIFYFFIKFTVKNDVYPQLNLFLFIIHILGVFVLMPKPQFTQM